MTISAHQIRLGSTARHLRESKDLSQEQLAHQVGVSTKTVSRFENGYEVRRSSVLKITEVLGIAEPDQGTQLDRIEAKLDELLAALRKRDG
jgi:transcriptional regulator with XRE-family HTH domain